MTESETEPRPPDSNLLCFIHVSMSRHQREADEQFQATVKALAEVVECYFLTGEQDYMLQVAVPNHRHITRLLADLTKCSAVDRLRTSVVLRQVKGAARRP